MIRILLASHGELSKGILNSAQMIVGDVDKNVETYSLYPGQNPLDYVEELKERIINGNDSWIIIADILGGSVYTALSQLTAYGDVTIFSGMNLNLVLNIFLDSLEDMSEEYLSTIAECAKTGITCTKHLDTQKEDIF